MKNCNKKFDVALNQYLETCAYYDELTLQHPVLLNLAEESDQSYQDVHYEDLECRFACRSTEIRILKSKYAQKLTLLRMTYVSFICVPMLNCIEKIVPYLVPKYFCYSGFRVSDLKEVILFTLQHVMSWLAINFLNIESPKTLIDQLVSNIECYTDEISLKKRDMYLMLGGSEFTNRMTRNYLSAMQVLYNRREAFQFLLVSKKLSSSKSKLTTSIMLSRLTVENQFFGNNDLIRLVISFIIGNQNLYCPVHIMFSFP
jgi:hypothetical protein